MDALDGCDVARVWRVRARGSGVDRARVERDRGCDARDGEYSFFLTEPCARAHGDAVRARGAFGDG